ncbi:MAG TPA: aldo/keto reductase [Thermoplasmata archaeon]|nr:aldo/keto reductase [Thermoplasmata archaeon]
MEQVSLGRSGLRVSEIGLGMWQAGEPIWGKDYTEDECVAAMRRAHELGITLIDTAEGYGHGRSEEVVGRAVKEIGRENLVLATKVHHPRYEHVLKACDASLKRLAVKEIDLYQVHWPDPWAQVPLRHTFRALEELHRDGKIRAIGVSNFAVRDLEEARSLLSRTDIASNQVRYNLIDREVEEQVVPYCKRENITVLAWSPLAKGILTGKYEPGKARPSDELRKDSPSFREANLKEYEKVLGPLREIAAKLGKTPGQVALNWLMRDGNAVPIPGAKRVEQAEENAGAAGWRISRAEVETLRQASNSLILDLF